MLLRPVHPIHYDLGSFAGWKVVVIVLWLPIAAVLVARCSGPTLDPQPLEVARVRRRDLGRLPDPVVSAVGARHDHVLDDAGSAIFEAYFMAELLLSGRLVPLALMPGWVQALADVLPFQWTFGFPIAALVGPISDRGAARRPRRRRLLWIVVGRWSVRGRCGGAVRRVLGGGRLSDGDRWRVAPGAVSSCGSAR